MKSLSVLDKYVKPKPDGEAALSEETDEPDDLGSFGWLRGIRDRAIMLELRQKDGTMTAFGYAWLERVEFDPSEGITLKFTGATVKITGRHLNGESRPNVRLLAGILRHRVPWIQEAGGAQFLQSPKDATVIEAIKVERGSKIRLAANGRREVAGRVRSRDTSPRPPRIAPHESSAAPSAPLCMGRKSPASVCRTEARKDALDRRPIVRTARGGEMRRASRAANQLQPASP